MAVVLSGPSPEDADFVPGWLTELAALTESFGEARVAASAGGECPSCPVCTGLALLRARHPEVHEHVTAALSAMMTLLRDAVPREAAPDVPAPAPASGGFGGSGGVAVKEQQIEVTD